MAARRCCDRATRRGSRPASPTAITPPTSPRATRPIPRWARAPSRSARTIPMSIWAARRTSTVFVFRTGRASLTRRSLSAMANFKLDTDADGIALVSWDAPGRAMNGIDLKVIEELSAIVETIANDAAIKGAVITSDKETFCVGADLTMLELYSRKIAELGKARGNDAGVALLFEESRKLSLLYRRIETCGKPWVAAISGTALGGGFELCLACHHRVAAPNPKTRLRPA